MIAKVYVTLKSGVLDPQGKAVKHSLATLGYNEVEDVRVGRLVELKIKDDSKEGAKERIKKMCEDLLANTVIESYKFEIV